MPLYLRYFVAIWLAYFLLCLAVPLEPVSDQFARAILYQTCFVAMVVVGATLTSRLLFAAGLDAAPQATTVVQGEPNRLLLTICLTGSLIGLGSLAYDRIILQEIDFSAGIANAREQWRRLGEQRGGVSSVFSILGYLLTTSSLVALGMMSLWSERLSRTERTLILVTVVVVVMAISVLSGGRSTVLLAIVLALAFYSLRRETGGAPIRITAMNGLVLSAIFAVALGYSTYVFATRAAASEENPLYYANGTLAHLGMRPVDWLQSLDIPSWATALLSQLLLVVAYVTHSAATFATIIENSDGRGTIMFGHILQLIAKLGITPAPDTEWFLSGLFPSVPGALYHQYGEAGLLAGGLALGGASGLARNIFLAFPASVPALGLASSAYATLFLSPILFAPDFMSFPFLLFQFFAFPAIACGLALLASRVGLRSGRR